MKKSILFVLFLLLISYSVFGQISVSGRVTSEDGALPGVTVQIKGTTKGTQTDVEGNFVITVDSENDILVFRFVGYETKEIKVSEINFNKNIILIEAKLTECFLPASTLKINYWGGMFYNPYGVSISKVKYFYSINRYIIFDTGYSTDFQDNYDFYGRIETQILKRYTSYKFQQTTFQQAETENKIATHILESNSYLRFVKSKLLYGIGHQTFSKKGLENDKTNNYGIHLGLSKYIKYTGTISAKSFYWQDYWAWEANLNKSFFYKKLRLNTAIAYRQTTQDFKEINLTLGYVF